MKNARIDIGACRWKLMGHWPYTPLQRKPLEEGQELMGVTDWIDARVPGGVQSDLLRAGLIPDPWYGNDSLLSEWVEHRWWRYKTVFDPPKDVRMERVTLEFKGVDYAAYFYLNNHKLGWHEGMYDPVVFDVAAQLREKNTLEVILESVQNEHSQIGYTSETKTQKSRFGYKWDFSTRLVNIGIWDDVELNCTGPYRLDDVFIQTDVDEDDAGLVLISGRIDGLNGRKDSVLTARLTGFGFDETMTFYVDPRDGSFIETIRVPAPELWQTNGLGKQPLYALTLEVSDTLGISDSLQRRIGIRKLRYRQCEGAPFDALPYVVEINDKPVYMKGVNMTPLRHCYGTLTRADYLRVLRQAQAMGVNLIRVWGGGIIEKECFYDLCDEMGIMVWQEFIQSSSGLDNIPSKDKHFLELLKTASVSALKSRRNHTCHTFWCGGNELMNTTDHPSNVGDENLAMLAALCEKYDPGKQFMPTSASGPVSWLSLEHPGINHDIHGNWKYDGIPQHYDIYNRSDCMLQSEFGCDGMSSIESLETFLPKANQRPTDMKTDLVWRHHGEWWDDYARDTDLFGKLTDLKRWTMISQFVQAEAIRYGLEANRRRKFRNAGSFIWQINEPWPNVSCTSLLEYNGTAKMAAYQVRKAFAPVAMSLRYDSIVAPADQPFTLTPFVVNATESAEYTARIEIYDLQGDLYADAEETVSVDENAVARLSACTFELPQLMNDLFVVRLILNNAEDQTVFTNELLFSQREKTPFAGLQQLPETQIKCELDDDLLVIVNIGETAAMFVHPVSLDRDEPILAGDSHHILLPNEETAIHLECLNGLVLPPIGVRSLNTEEIEL